MIANQQLSSSEFKITVSCSTKVNCFCYVDISQVPAVPSYFKVTDALPISKESVGCFYEIKTYNKEKICQDA